MATKKAFKMNNVNKVMFVHEFVMKMRDAKVIYALRKVIEKDLKISFNEYVCNHLTNIDSVKNLFSDSMKLLTYKRNAELVKLSFDYKKIDSSWRKVVDKLINPTEEEETKENTKVKASTKKEKVSNEETTKEVKKRGRKSKNEAKEDEEKKKKETTKVKKDTKVEAKKDTKTVVDTKKTKTVVKKKDSKTVLAEAKKNEETEKAIAETTATTTSNEAK